MRPLPTRIVILEQRILPPPAPVDYRAEDEAVGLNLAAGLAELGGLALDDAPAEGDLLVWVLDRLGAPTHTPGYQPGAPAVEMSQAERCAVLLGMTPHELRAALQTGKSK
ncbi:MAG TPA: hypothetical protein VIU62_20250 [Chloroflexota bacterium]|jgi:hypothetical protein|nr:hypothetical protein [Arthrobacter sp.]